MAVAIPTHAVRKGTSAALRDAFARLFRCCPYFPFKTHLSGYLNHHLTRREHDSACLVPVRMQDGSQLLLDARSETEWPALWTGCYDRALIDALVHRLPKNAVVLDVGANIGFWSIALGRRLQHLQGRVFAFEPVPANFARLVDNIRRNRLDNVVQPFALALGDRHEQVAMHRDERRNAGTGNAVVVAENGAARANVQAWMTTLDRAAESLALPACHLIKVDIEGGEMCFLHGARSFLRQYRPLVVCEINAFWMDKFGWSLADLSAFADEMDYYIRRLRTGRFSHGDVEDVLLLPKARSSFS